MNKNGDSFKKILLLLLFNFFLFNVLTLLRIQFQLKALFEFWNTCINFLLNLKMMQVKNFFKAKNNIFSTFKLYLLKNM